MRNRVEPGSRFLARWAPSIRSGVPIKRPQHSPGSASRACARMASTAALEISNSDASTVQRFNRHRDAHSAADAQRRDAVPSLLRTQSIDEGRQDARAAGADRMSERHRTAVNIDLRRIETEL